MEMMWQEFGAVPKAEAGLVGQLSHMALTATILILAVLVIISIIRSVLGPGISDRILAVNMIGTIVIMMIAVLSVFLDQNYLVDVCLIYAMISFLGVVVLCKVYTGVYLQRKHMKADIHAIDDNLHHQEGDVVDMVPDTKEEKGAKI
ncbi:MAG: monovalent cation/H+ antiporter complex subunit F [Brotaphodocola sp.]